MPAARTLALLLISVACLSLISAPGGSLESAKTLPALELGNRRQLFIDNRFFQSATNVSLVLHPPQKTGEPTLLPDRPWETGGLGVYCTVIQSGGLYHLWYDAQGGICYARSTNGIEWEKPNLGLANFNGDTNNNIVLGCGAGGVAKCSSEGMVFLDPTAPPDQLFRYATRISDELKDTVVFSSPDGIHWRLTHQKVLTFTNPEGRQHLDSQNVIFWDDGIKKYVAYLRRNQFKPGFRGRSIARAESDHLGGFAEAQDAPVVIGPDALDAALGGKPVVDYYTSGSFKYPWAQDVYLMFPQVYFSYPPGQLPEFPKGTPHPANSGPLHTQFAASRDGLHWQRFGREPFVRLGLKGEFDSKGARVFYGIATSVDGTQLYLYYLGTDELHGWGRDEKNKKLLTAAGLAPVKNTSYISRLVLRRDGFVSARAAYTGGEFTTPSLRVAGRELVLNVDTSATGFLRCELLDASGSPIKNYSLDDCDLIHTANELDRVVKWRGRSDLPAASSGQPVRLRVVFRDTDLYAFQFR